MPIPELTAYIRQRTLDGVSASDLRVELMEAGWSELDVDNALHDLAAGLRPVTEGASIHEDLAQVRGMVAHLASRLKLIENQLPVLMVPGTELILPAKTSTKSHHWGRLIALFFTIDALILGSVGILMAWRSYQVISAQTAVALEILLIAIVLVVGLKLRRSN